MSNLKIRQRSAVLLGLALVMATSTACKPDSFSKARSTIPEGVEFDRVIGYVVGQGIVYVGKRGAQVFVVRGSKEDGPYESFGSAAVSPNGRSLAYMAKRGGKELIVLDGKEVAHSDCADLKISPDGASVACINGAEVAIMLNRQGQFRGWSALKNAIVLRDGKQVGHQQFDEVSALTFDGKGRIVFAAKTGDRWSVMREGAAIASGYSAVTEILDCDDGTVVYTAERGDESVVAVEGREGPPLKASIGLVCRRGTFAYAAKDKDGKLGMYLNGKVESGAYDDMSSPALSGDGHHLAYHAGLGTQKYLVLDGKAQPVGYSGLSRPWPTFHGESTFSVQDADGNYAVFVDGRSQATFEGLRSVFPLVRSALLVGKKESGGHPQWFASVSGKNFGPYDDLAGVHLSEDGRKVGFVIRSGRNLEHMVYAE